MYINSALFNTKTWRNYLPLNNVENNVIILMMINNASILSYMIIQVSSESNEISVKDHQSRQIMIKACVHK